jgi:hypothetical protein
MKENRNISFAKATITEENGEFIITETVKDDTKVYNLTEKIREWINIEGVSLKLAKDSEIPSEE